MPVPDEEMNSVIILGPLFRLPDLGEPSSGIHKFYQGCGSGFRFSRKNRIKPSRKPGSDPTLEKTRSGPDPREKKPESETDPEK